MRNLGLGVRFHITSRSLGPLIALLALVGCGRNPASEPNEITAVLTNPVERVSPEGPIGVKFSVPMQRQSVEVELSFNPPIECEFDWGFGSTELVCNPISPLLPDHEYEVVLRQGASSTSEMTLEQDFRWVFSTRCHSELFVDTQITGVMREIVLERLCEVPEAHRDHFLVVTSDGQVATNRTWLLEVLPQPIRTYELYEDRSRLHTLDASAACTDDSTGPRRRVTTAAGTGLGAFPILTQYTRFAYAYADVDLPGIDGVDSSDILEGRSDERPYIMMGGDATNSSGNWLASTDVGLMYERLDWRSTMGRHTHAAMMPSGTHTALLRA